ncbi:hypothetical protein PTKIN_Ptkin04bG0027300 [Pterospermum kingtungense]
MHISTSKFAGQEGENPPKDCLELDPAATPLELFQVSIEAEVKEIEIKESAREETLECVGQAMKPEPMAMDVPDPDSHDFNQDRSEKSFGGNQV